MGSSLARQHVIGGPLADCYGGHLLETGHHQMVLSNARPIVDEPVIHPRTIRSDLKPALAEFLIKACASANVDRFSTAADMQLALQQIHADL